MSRDKKRESRTRLILIAVVCLAVAAAFLYPRIRDAAAKPLRRSAMEEAYRQGIELYNSGQYTEAEKAFGELDEDYEHVTEYRTLCAAHIRFDEGDLDGAKECVMAYDYHFLEGEELLTFQLFRQTVNRECRLRQEEIWAEAARNRRQSAGTQSGPVYPAPKVGMNEVLISSTGLGPYHERYVKPYKKDTEWREYHVYYWYDYYGMMTFWAGCEDGIVIKIGDHRDYPKKPFEPGRHTGYGPYIDPGPEVDGFSNPEDFYDFYSEDFDGYYDAEDYYYEHGGR